MFQIPPSLPEVAQDMFSHVSEKVPTGAEAAAAHPVHDHTFEVCNQCSHIFDKKGVRLDMAVEYGKLGLTYPHDTVNMAQLSVGGMGQAIVNAAMFAYKAPYLRTLKLAWTFFEGEVDKAQLEEACKLIQVLSNKKDLKIKISVLNLEFGNASQYKAVRVALDNKIDFVGLCDPDLPPNSRLRHDTASIVGDLVRGLDETHVTQFVIARSLYTQQEKPLKKEKIKDDNGEWIDNSYFNPIEYFEYDNNDKENRAILSTVIVDHKSGNSPQYTEISEYLQNGNEVYKRDMATHFRPISAMVDVYFKGTLQAPPKPSM